ncbi:unnamed protein product [Anisakis simplex]|uniref:Uncharacterized protein n=1 Tax=Anisakis simplex TaxID=6269 RepID=A0A3P6RZ79_ANISI|nr:unnamed protein product [Anisakis simplex]
MLEQRDGVDPGNQQLVQQPQAPAQPQQPSALDLATNYTAISSSTPWTTTATISDTPFLITDQACSMNVSSAAALSSLQPASTPDLAVYRQVISAPPLSNTTLPIAAIEVPVVRQTEEEETAAAVSAVQAIKSEVIQPDSPKPQEESDINAASTNDTK